MNPYIKAALMTLGVIACFVFFMFIFYLFDKMKEGKRWATIVFTILVVAILYLVTLLFIKQ